MTRTGFEDGLFAAWRNDPDFVLNRPEYAGATILVAGPEFGTGSSREHAVWALQNYGFRVVLSSRFADIFRGNAGKGGLVAAAIPQPEIEALWAAVDADPTTAVTVDLESRTVSWGDHVGRFRDRRLHALEAARRPRRHRSDVASCRRDHAVRAAPTGLDARNWLKIAATQGKKARRSLYRRAFPPNVAGGSSDCSTRD